MLLICIQLCIRVLCDIVINLNIFFYLSKCIEICRVVVYLKSLLKPFYIKWNLCFFLHMVHVIIFNAKLSSLRHILFTNLSFFFSLTSIEYYSWQNLSSHVFSIDTIKYVSVFSKLGRIFHLFFVQGKCNIKNPF